MIRTITIFLLSFFLYEQGSAQTRVIRGIVLDSASHVPIQNVSIRVLNNHAGAISNAEGEFRIIVDEKVEKLMFTATGYHPYSLSLRNTIEQQFTILLSKAYTTLADVVVNAKKGKYRNKNNPAVELIRKVIANKSKNGPGSEPYTSYKQHEKIRVLFDKFPSFFVNNFVMRKFRFVLDNVDTSLVPGKSLVPVYIEEVLSDNYFRKQPEKKKKVVLARKVTDFGEYLDMKAISSAVNRLYEDIRIYDNTITAFTMQFVSPIADLAPDFYMYFIQDTLVENGEKLVQLHFIPRNAEDLLFRGTLYITLDGNYAVRKAELEVGKHINLNYIRNFKVNQDFEKGANGRYHLSNSDMVAFFSPFPRTPGVFGERIVSITGQTDSIIPESVLRGSLVDTLSHAYSRPDTFWRKERSIPLSVPETRTYSNIDSLRKMKSYNRLADYITLLTAGYKSVGKFEIGPVGSFYSFNTVEGKRLQFGGRSKTKLSTRYYADGYLAYGLRDQRWKYYLSGTYSINNRSIYSFPFHYIQASYQRDIKNLGQEDVFAQGNSFLASFNRGLNSAWIYNNIFRMSYVREFENHFSYNLGLKYWLQQPAGSLSYIYERSPGKSDTAQEITTGEISATLRWAPNEQFYQGKTIRRDMVNKYPIFVLQYAKGIQGLFGGQYSYDALHLSVYKRLYLAPFGFSDIFMDAGYLAGNLPYPLLIIHPANQSYFYSENAYNLMNIGEFVSDHYAGMHIDHFFGGFFFNKIPLLKKLRLREVIAAKILFGGLRNENNPAVNPEQMKFPLLNGLTSTYILGRQPYLEASVGIYNIFSIIRVDLVKRFTYLGHPGISTLGLRFSSNFNF